MRASWGLSRWLLPRVRSAGSAGVAMRIADIIVRCERGGDAHACIPAPCLLSYRVFVRGVYALLEPCDLVGEQTRWNLRCAAGDLHRGEQRGYSKVERLFARVGAGGTCIVGQEL